MKLTMQAKVVNGWRK